MEREQASLPTARPNLGLEGRRILVTGGAAGIGLAMTEAFLAQGAKVLMFDNDGQALQAEAARLAAGGNSIETCAGSVAEPADIERTFAQADCLWGGLDVLLNNAGIAMNLPSLELKLEDWRRALDINLTGPFLCAQAAGRRMAGKGGVILNVGSMYGEVAAPERLAYCATKSALAMMTKVLAIEWASLGIRVNAVAPGYVRTALVERLLEAKRLDEEAITRRTPLKRLARTEEVAELAVFLASDRAAYMTGQVVSIDGGWTAYGYV